MQIFIKVHKEGEKLPELGLLEFQGDFCNRSGDGKPMFDEFIGDLSFTKDGTPFFIIGHHILYGQEVKLHRPIVVLYKVNDADNYESKTKYSAKAVIRKKIIFKSRPKPIIALETVKITSET